MSESSLLQQMNDIIKGKNKEKLTTFLNNNEAFIKKVRPNETRTAAVGGFKNLADELIAENITFVENEAKAKKKLDEFTQKKQFKFPSKLGKTEFNSNNPDFEWIKITAGVTRKTVIGNTLSAAKIGGISVPQAEFHFPMPQVLNENLKSNWANTDIGTGLGEGITDGAGSFDVGSVLGATGTGVTEQIKKFLTKMGGAITGINGEAVRSLVGGGGAGQILNPHTEVLFKGTDFRKFSFTWLMHPEDETDSTKLRKIIQTLKFHTAPSFEDSTNNNFLVFPSNWKIQFYVSKGTTTAVENKFIPKIATCVCNGVDVQFNSKSGGWTTFDDGAPTDILLKLDFTETVLMTKSQILSDH